MDAETLQASEVEGGWREGELRELEEGFLSATKVTRHHAKSFYFCSITLPPPKRRAAYAVYAFCRHVDDAVDECGGDLELAAERVEAIGRLLDRVYARDPALEEVWKAFSMTVAAYGIPRAYFETLIRGVMMDLEPVYYATWEELDDYCYHVAGVVGLIMTRIFGAAPGHDIDEALAYARHLGTAMQLTNILRDVAEDWDDRRRLYLPREELERFAVTEEDIEASRATDGFKALMAFQIQRARHYYALAERGIPMLTDDGSRLTVLAMSRVYGAILDEIEKLDLDVFQTRAFTSTLTKVHWLLRSYGTLTRLRLDRELARLS